MSRFSFQEVSQLHALDSIWNTKNHDSILTGKENPFNRGASQVGPSIQYQFGQGTSAFDYDPLYTESACNNYKVSTSPLDLQEPN